MNTRRAALAGAFAIALTVAACDRETDRPEAPQDDDVSVDEQMSPASDNRPAGIGREDTTATPGTRPTDTGQPEDQTEIRDRLPPDE